MAKRRRRRLRRHRRTGRPTLGTRSRKKTAPPRPGSLDTSDEDFEMDPEEEEQSSIDEDASSSAESGSDDEKADDDDCDEIGERPSKRPRTSRPAQRNRRSPRSGSSSDEDFEIDALEDEDFVLASESGKLQDGGAIQTRSARRARLSSGASSSGIQRESSHGQASLSEVSRNSRVNAQTSTESTALWAEQRLKEDKHRQINKLSILASGTANNVGTGVVSSKFKGKGKITQGEEMGRTKQEESAPVCGVCLCEDGQVERGKLDCCEHFFCFGCIMEWAKVESRCPMCKQRFVSIVRAGGVGSKRTRTVRIPLRDQVYVPPEDDTLAADDPYSDVICMECHESGEERLLLLCDHCDSAAHTYCVGLGRSVPRGDWFCRSCQALIAEVFGSEDEDEEILLVPSDDGDNEEDEDFECQESVLRAIVASPEVRAQQRRQSRTLEASNSRIRTSSTVSTSGGMGVRRRLSGRYRSRSIHAAPRLSQAAMTLMRETELASGQQVNTQAQVAVTLPSSARTVPRQRRLQERIHIMRTNWERIQTGALEFSTLGAHTAVPSVITPNITNILPQTSGATEGTPKSTGPSSLCEHQRSENENVKLERVWEMMDRAKSLPSTSSQQRTGATEQGAGVFDRQGNIGVVKPLLSPAPNSSGASSDISLPYRQRASTSAMTDGKPCSMGNIVPGSARVEQILDQNVCARNTSGHVGTSSKQNLEALGKSLENSGRLTVKTSSDAEHELKSMHKHEKANDLLQNISSERCGNHNSSTLAVARGGKDVLRTSKEHVAHLLATHLEKERAADSSLVGMQKRTNERLKVHITELVKKQLWPLYLTEGLGKEQFKQIARSAVHMLLDTLENGRHTASDPTCGHVELQDSSTLLGCCSSCLNSRVEKAVRVAKDKAHIC